MLWLLRKNSPLCRQLPVLPWVKFPGLTLLPMGWGAVINFDRNHPLLLCISEFSTIPLCLFEICSAFQKLFFLPHALAQTPTGHPHSLEVTATGDFWSFLLKK